MIDELLTLDDVARMLHVTKTTLRRWDNAGKLKAVRINQRGYRRYKKAEVLDFLERLNPNG